MAIPVAIQLSDDKGHVLGKSDQLTKIEILLKDEVIKYLFLSLNLRSLEMYSLYPSIVNAF
jgi:hypothetical protein